MGHGCSSCSDGCGKDQEIHSVQAGSELGLQALPHLEEAEVAELKSSSNLLQASISNAENCKSNNESASSPAAPVQDVSPAAAQAAMDVKAEKEPLATAEKAEALPVAAPGNVDEAVESLLKECVRAIEEDAVPSDSSQLAASGWRDISKPSAKVYYKAKTGPARDCISIKVRSQDQVPELPLLKVQNGHIRCGAIPTVWATSYWNLWFPFCDSTKMLRLVSPTRFICQIILKVMFLTLDFIICVCIEDRLEDKGSVDVMIQSPPPGSENKQWLGITVPPKSGSLPRICIRNARVEARPTSPGNVDLFTQAEMDDVSGAPQWLKTFVFQQLAIRIVPDLVKFQGKIPGSPLDKYLNGKGDGCVDADALDFMFAINRNIEDFLSKRPSSS
eukprot:TRINITY_DN74499_c0_g1_i1.p1 TRINITY_DN74499_c0_g1~~TRINITY_DN74499_c0_g1_i1.p1  ORF type:complete len:389 (-),score=79.07 TRINITY_DN74499_c0_g1_i1:37-1203(-)